MSHYDTLGVARDASAADIKRAYRKAALQWHPDKNTSPEAEEQFVKIAQAYEVLGDADARRQYDRYGSSVSGVGARGGPGGGFDFARARDLFDENFGEALAKRWKPGMRLSGKRVQNGKAYTITIHPDGSTEEEEVAMGGRASGYQYVKSTSASGASSVSIQVHAPRNTAGSWRCARASLQPTLFMSSSRDPISVIILPRLDLTLPISCITPQVDSLGGLLVALVPGLSMLPGPVVGVATTLLSWVPTVLMLLCCYRCCFKPTHPAAREDADEKRR
eukprot:7335726-Prymnesium_polylepis.1